MGMNERYGTKLYQRVSMVGSTPFERLETLYSGAIRLARQGRRDALHGNEDEAAHRADKVSAILQRLDICLDHDLAPDLSANLSRLYGHMRARLAEPDASLEPTVFDEVLTLLNTLWDGFEQAERQSGE